MSTFSCDCHGLKRKNNVKKLVGILTVTDVNEACNSSQNNVENAVNTLEKCGFLVGQTTFVRKCTFHLKNQLILLIKNYDFVFAIIDQNDINLICKVLSAIFNEKLIENKVDFGCNQIVKVPVSSTILKLKKLQNCNSFTEVNDLFPVVYAQRLFILANNNNNMFGSLFEQLVNYFPLFKYVNSNNKNAIRIEDKCELKTNGYKHNTDEEQVYEDMKSVVYIKNAISYIEDCLLKYGPDDCFISFNGGKDCTVLLHLYLIVLKKQYPEYNKPVLCMYVQSKDPFEEVDEFINKIAKLYNIKIVTFTQSIKESLAAILQENDNLKACLMGTRRTDPYSNHLQISQMTDKDWPQILRVHPILDWHYSQIWDYLLMFNVPYCILYDRGFTSLGSKNNTIPNPELLISKEEKQYLPAYKLLDGSKERCGRCFHEGSYCSVKAATHLNKHEETKKKIMKTVYYNICTY